MKIRILVACTLFSFFGISQTPDEVFDAERVRNRDIHLNHNLHVNFDSRSESFQKISDSALLTVSKHYCVYIKAFNPLHFSFNSDHKLVSDEIDKKALEAIDNIVNILNGQSTLDADESEKEVDGYAFELESFPPAPKSEEDHFLNSLLALAKKVKKDRAEGCNELMKSLIDMSFRDRDQTSTDLKDVKTKKSLIVSFYSELEEDLSKLNERISEKLNTESIDVDKWVKWTVFRGYSKELSSVIKEQKKRISNLTIVQEKIDEAMKNWESKIRSETFNGEWFLVVRRGEMTRGKLDVLTFTMNSHKTTLDGDNIKVEESTTKTKTLRLRKYSLIVPEASAGFIYTNQSYPTYSLDASNQIGRTDEAALDRIAISSMLNLNFVIPNSPINPFIQIGAGVNRELPLGLLGAGFRFDLGAKNRTFAVSFGASFTGIKDLDDKKVGDTVSDQLELEDNLKYRFSGPKAYFGIQYNF